MTNGKDTAMPFTYQSEDNVEAGLTKREHFAAMAMQGLCASGFFTDAKLQKECESVKSNTSIAIAVSAVDLADALIRALNEDAK